MHTWGVPVDCLADFLGVVLSKLATQRSADISKSGQAVHLLVACLCLCLQVLSNGQVKWLVCVCDACAMKLTFNVGML